MNPQMPPPKPMGMPKSAPAAPADESPEEEAQDESMVPAVIEMLEEMSPAELQQVCDAAQKKLAGEKPGAETEVPLE